MNRLSVIWLLLICAQQIGAQDSLFVDPRDEKTYPIVEIGDLHWFGANLSYETPSSWCAEEVKAKHCADGNYYYNTEFDSLCPQDWRVATWIDWENSLKHIVQRHGMSPDSITYDTLPHGAVLVSGFDLINDTLGLNIKTTGYVEGAPGKAKRKIKHSLASFWVIHEETNDPRTHIHIANQGLNVHSHDSAINDIPRKKRRFAVRCVSDKK